jgi:hypothetical protein
MKLYLAAQGMRLFLLYFLQIEAVSVMELTE